MPPIVFGEHRQHLQRVIEGVLRAVDPAEALIRHWPKDEATAAALRSGVLVAAGKASVGMTLAAVDRLGMRPTPGVLLAPAGLRAPPSLHAANVRVFEVDHPLPTQRNLIAGRAVGDAARLASSRKVPLVVLLSGGASAHLTVPDRGLSLSDVRTITDLLLKSGATIEEINTVRQCCETLKAGGMARAAAPAPVYAFILSDVLGDPEPLGLIASGPTANVVRSPSRAIQVLEARALLSAVPSVTAHLRTEAKANAAIHPVTNATNIVIGSNVGAVLAARTALEEQGFRIIETRMSVEGDAAERGRELARLLRRCAAERQEGSQPAAVVWGGETTVRVSTPGAFGGRNQEAALAAAMELGGEHPVRGAAVMCFATDGVDGVTPSGKPAQAGAIVTSDSVEQARKAGLDAVEALRTHASYAWCNAAETVLKTGPTGTNVNDIWVGILY